MIEIFGSRELAFGDGTFLPAASGIVARDALFVVSDERPLVGRFPFVLDRPQALPLSDAAVPEDAAERKATKPDLEAITVLPGGHLLVLGSGSTDRRERGWILPQGGGAPVEISLSGLYARLRRELADLNIEGAALTPDRSLWLAQRGNGAEGSNALVEIALPAEGTFELRSVKAVDLPPVDGVPLTLTDLESFSGRLYFTAVAEDVASTYDDGPCVGAAVGVLDPLSGEVVELELLAQPWKVEGIAHARGMLYLVVDPDDPEQPGLLLEGRSALAGP